MAEQEGASGRNYSGRCFCADIIFAIPAVRTRHMLYDSNCVSVNGHPAMGLVRVKICVFPFRTSGRDITKTHFSIFSVFLTVAVSTFALRSLNQRVVG